MVLLCFFNMLNEVERLVSGNERSEHNGRGEVRKVDN